MFRRTKSPGLSFLAAVLFAGLSACGGGGSGSTNIKVTSVTIAPASASVQINSTFQFTATLALSSTSSTTPTTVTWYVNGVSGGNSQVGTIVSSGTDNEVGVYTAPTVVPTTNNGQVNITAETLEFPNNTSDTTMVTSNTAIATVTVGSGLIVSPTGVSVSAGAQQQFSALLNNLPDNNVSWSVSSTNGGNVGTIDPFSGLYTAPPSPPPGGTITVTATSQNPAGTGTATAQIIYSNASFQGPLAFSYRGDDTTGFLAAAGSFVSDGKGSIASGVEDFVTLDNGGESFAQDQITSGQYTVSADGRGSGVIFTRNITSGIKFQFALTSNQHAEMIRFDSFATGSGTIDQQNLSDLSPPPPPSLDSISGPYVFDLTGTNASFEPRGIAGAFSANGLGQIAAANSILDDNNNGVISTSDRSLSGSYSFDTVYAGSGRGTLTLTSTTTGTFSFAFYVIDATHLYLIETDEKAFLAGDVWSAPAGNSFTTASLAKGNFVFASGGNPDALLTGAYASGGVFTSDGAGNISGGVLDVNNNGVTTLNTTLGSCPYTVDSTTGRVDLRLFAGSGTCGAGASSSVSEFAVYQTAAGSAVMLELDSTAIATGNAYVQNLALPAGGNLTSLTGSFALNLAGQGINSPFRQDLSGQVGLTGAAVSGGNIDINPAGPPILKDPIGTTSTIATPGATGRGTALLVATNPGVKYNLVYYIANDNTALVLDSDPRVIATGVFARQY